MSCRKLEGKVAVVDIDDQELWRSLPKALAISQIANLVSCDWLDPIPIVATVTEYLNGIMCWYTIYQNGMCVLAMQVLEFVCPNYGDQSAFGILSRTCTM